MWVCTSTAGEGDGVGPVGISGEQERDSWVVTMASASGSSEFELTEELGLGYGEITPSISSSSR